MKRILAACLITPAMALTIGACSSAEPEPTHDADGVEVTTSVNQPEDVNGVDLHFIAMMTPHHQQAVDMSETILEAEGISEETRDLAQRIKDGQQEEIDVMVNWAHTWEQQDLMDHHAPHIANGMLMPEQMEELETLSGEEADTLFLQLMHYHHEGAVAMTQDQINNGGHQPVIDLAQQMMDIQTAEMEEMEQLLASKGETTLTS